MGPDWESPRRRCGLTLPLHVSQTCRNEPAEDLELIAWDVFNRLASRQRAGTGDLHKWRFNVILIDFLSFESSRISQMERKGTGLFDPPSAFQIKYGPFSEK